MKILLNETSFSLFLLTLFTFLLNFYLIILRNKEKSTYFLIGFYTNVFFMFSSALIGISIPRVYGTKILIFQYVFAQYALLFLLLFSYYCYEKFKEAEAKIVSLFFSTTSVSITIYILHGIFSGKQFNGKDLAWIAILDALEIIWVSLVFIRKSWKITRTSPESKRGIINILLPADYRARRILYFAYLMAIPIILSLFVFAAYNDIIPVDLHNFVFAEGSALFFFLFVLVYLNYSNFPISLIFKIVGVTLVSVILLLNTIGFLLIKENQAYYSKINELKARVCMERIAQNKFYGFPRDIVYILKNSRHNPFSNNFTVIYATKEMNREIIIKDNLIKTKIFHKIIPFSRLTRNYYAPLYSEAKYFSYFFYKGDSVYEVGISPYSYRLKIHKIVFKFIITSLILFLLIIFIFPLFFKPTIIGPVKHLIEGARKMEKGNFDVEFPVRVRDEFGILSDVFNKLAFSLKKYREALLNYSRILEKKVEERTRDLENKNKILLEMKKKLELTARTDPLTGLLNRRALYEFIDHEVKRTKRSKKGFSIILADIDNFKHINDTYGHACGDRVLRKISRILKSTLRQTDKVGRWGGEEFLILLPETSLEGAVRVAEKLRMSIASENFRCSGKLTLRLTMTFGVAEFTPQTPSLRECLKNADEALYRGKSSGKNIVFSIEEDSKLF